MDGLGQTSNGRSGDHDENGVVNGHAWAERNWSSAGAALEPSYESLHAFPAAGQQGPATHAENGTGRLESGGPPGGSLNGSHHDSLSAADLIRPPHFVPFSMAEDPYADELAQRSAEFARHAALEDPTPPQGLPSLPPAWAHEGEDPPLAASLSLGQRFELAFAEEPEPAPPEPEQAPPPVRPPTPTPMEPPAPPAAAVPPTPMAPIPVAPPAAAAPVPHAPSPARPAMQPPARPAAQPPAGPAVVRQEPFPPGHPAPPAPVVVPAPLIPPTPITHPPEAQATRPEQRFEREFGAEEAAEPDDSALPQRVPAEPDVPATPEPAEELPLAGMPQLSRIASHLRRDDCPPAERPDGFDTDAVLAAVRSVAGVREAIMRTTPTGAHHLRLELAEGADPATISRMVARMLQDQMGIDAALAGDPPARIPGQPAAEETEPPPPPVSLPGPRIGTGATPPSAAFEPRPPSAAYEPRQMERAPERPEPPPVREPRRRHPVSVPRRQQQPGDTRPTERATPTWRSASDVEQPAGTTPPPLHTDRDHGPRAIIEHVQTSTFGLDATVEVRLTAGDRQASGVASGPAVDAYVLRLCAAATAAAVDDLLRGGTTTGESGRCFVEHAAIVPMGSCDVAVVVVLLVCGGWVEQLAGSALVSGDPRRAVVRATLGAVNRRLAALLPGSD